MISEVNVEGNPQCQLSKQQIEQLTSSLRFCHPISRHITITESLCGRQRKVCFCPLGNFMTGWLNQNEAVRSFLPRLASASCNHAFTRNGLRMHLSDINSDDIVHRVIFWYLHNLRRLQNHNTGELPPEVRAALANADNNNEEDGTEELQGNMLQTTCTICCFKISRDNVGKYNACDHLFCYTCMERLEANAPGPSHMRCPNCMQPYSNYERLDSRQARTIELRRSGSGQGDAIQILSDDEEGANSNIAETNNNNETVNNSDDRPNNEVEEITNRPNSSPNLTSNINNATETDTDDLFGTTDSSENNDDDSLYVDNDSNASNEIGNNGDADNRDEITSENFTAVREVISICRCTEEQAIDALIYTNWDVAFAQRIVRGEDKISQYLNQATRLLPQDDSISREREP